MLGRVRKCRVATIGGASTFCLTVALDMKAAMGRSVTVDVSIGVRLLGIIGYRAAGARPVSRLGLGLRPGLDIRIGVGIGARSVFVASTDFR